MPSSAVNTDNNEDNSVRATPKKLISSDSYTISHLISSDLKLISTSYHDFYCCIFGGKMIMYFW